MHWQVGTGAEHSAPTTEYTGGERKYYDPGTYYHHMRGQVTGTSPGDTVKVWFQAGSKKSSSFTYTAKNESANKVLLMAAEDYSGRSSDINPLPYPGPLYVDSY